MERRPKGAPTGTPFVVDDLTKRRRQLLQKARAFPAARNAWAWKGQIFVRLWGDRVVHVTEETEWDRLHDIAMKSPERSGLTHQHDGGQPFRFGSHRRGNNSENTPDRHVRRRATSRRRVSADSGRENVAAAARFHSDQHKHSMNTRDDSSRSCPDSPAQSDSIIPLLHDDGSPNTPSQMETGRTVSAWNDCPRENEMSQSHRGDTETQTESMPPEDSNRGSGEEGHKKETVPESSAAGQHPAETEDGEANTDRKGGDVAVGSPTSERPACPNQST